VNGDIQPICVRPVLWRALVFPLFFGFVGAASVALVVGVFTTSWPHIWPVMVGGAVGLAIGVGINWRGLALELDDATLRGPTGWGRRATIALDEVYWRPEPRPGFAAWFLGQRIVSSRDGRKVIIDRWQYPPGEMRRLLAELDRLAGERESGA
jgi:hypothetical protein